SWAIYLLLAPVVEGIVERGFELDLAMVVLLPDQGESVCDGLQPGALGCRPDVRRHVGRMDDPAECDEGRVPRQTVLEQDALERATAVFVPEIHPRDVIGRRTLASSDIQDVSSGDVEELRLRIDEPPDQPGAGDAIDLGVLACDPFHRRLDSCNRWSEWPVHGRTWYTQTSGCC